MEETGFGAVLIDHALAVIGQKLFDPGVPFYLSAAVPVDDRGITNGHWVTRPDGGAGVDLSLVQHDVHGLIHGQPMVLDTHRRLLV